MIDSDAQNYQSMAGNRILHAANKVKKDVFYTQLSDIANELGKRIAELIKDSDVQKKTREYQYSLGRFAHYKNRKGYLAKAVALNSLLNICVSI